MQLIDAVVSATSACPAAETDPADPGLARLVARFDADLARVRAPAASRADGERAWRALRQAIAAEGERALAALAAEVEPEAPAPADDPARERDRWIQRIAAAAGRMRAALRDACSRRLAECERVANAQQEQATRTSLSPRALARRREVAGDLADLAALTAQRERELDGCAGAAHVARAEVDARPSAAVVVDPDGERVRLRADLDAARRRCDELRAGAAFSACRPRGILVNHLITAAPHAVALAAVPWAEPLIVAIPWIALSAVATQALMLVVTRAARRQVAAQVARQRAALAAIADRLAGARRAAQRTLDLGGAVGRGIERLVDAQARHAAATAALQSGLTSALAALRQREARLIARAGTRGAGDAAARRIGDASARRRRAALRTARLEQARAALDARLARCDRDWEELAARCDQRRGEAIAEACAAAARAVRERDQRHPPWSAPAWQAWSPPADVAGDLPLGRMRLALDDAATLELPVSLVLPDQAALLVRTGADGREAALGLVNQVALRALAASAPGRLRVTLIDPVGLGGSFPALVGLADHDDGRVGGRVLTDPAAIEQGLADLAAHLELVIQKHLRDRYATLHDYNREAGELREAVRLVVVGDFPHGFSDRAVERLASIARSGARCGVHVLVVHDARRASPAGFDPAWFRRAGLVLDERDGRFAVAVGGDREWLIDPEPPPDAAVAARLIAAIGAAAQGARRVEVAFALVAPPASAVWSLSSATHLRIPIGRGGPDRVQHLELGRGTAQHALIGGRTGSGKSTLFHVLATSAALWYAPRELELYLIDFKKGVEFAIFARTRLPHARVVAIESDREFGLSVLRHLDRELVRRGELFRAAGAQNLAAHRAAGGEHLPRVLLLIDEFQEFFTDDDAVARDAALLLDRFVRQGRAFGLHVVLGSQTLGGAYALARSSLGQMGVRIALPSNEADAHLLLHEENNAGRLLSRPGEAIYNDRSGLAEGNSPFQVCWLAEQEEERCLTAAAQRAEAEGWRPSCPAVVFAGDAPARFADEPMLGELMARPRVAADAQLRACLGASNALFAVAEVVFPAAAGGNLLIVGQDRAAAATTCAAIAIGLAARHAPGDVRLIALDGEDRAGPFAELHQRLAALPHAPTRHDARDVDAVVAGLADELDGRRADPSAFAPVVLTVFALQRLRALQGGDELAFGGDEAGTAQRFARLLAEGPELGIHVVAWCDSLTSLQRVLGRRALRDFDARVAFQMSAADSAELIDDDAASRLGLHAALLAVASVGRRDKFRPFAAPDDGWLARFAEAIG
ncbi:MAG TPA: FtsK/SpoIIIE domain-containing protein [Planctomycetota bacterium]|nr:FtsK/SpoIIIE domain-containing protein [Planctomycetota bacterium]